MMLSAPEHRQLSVWSQMPAALRAPRRSAWADINMGGRELGCFLEGPVFDDAGNLFLVDIPFGRILRIDASGQWEIAAAYDGWPNGMKWRNGQLLIADHRLGLVELDPDSGRHRVLFGTIGEEPLLGLNDLTFAPDGTLYLTDQGQSGLHEPVGRVLRRGANGTLDILLQNCPSPNGLVFDVQRGWLYVAMTRGNCIWRVPFVEGRPSKVGLAIQLSGGIGPDGMALDADGCLLVVQAPLGVWQFDRHNMPRRFFAAPENAYVTNLVTRRQAGQVGLFVTDSINGRVLFGDLAAA